MFTTPNNHNVILSLKSGDEGVTIRHSSIDSDTIRVHCCSPYLRLFQGNQILEYHTVFLRFHLYYYDKSFMDLVNKYNNNMKIIRNKYDNIQK